MKKVKLTVLSVLFLVGIVSITVAQESTINFKPYGFIKLDMAYDQARTNNGNYVFWVDNGSDNAGNSEFNMTARQTRLGANISYDDLDDKVVTARFEFDFYGGGTENKNMPMLRHGFVKVDFGKYYLIAGQSSDIFSPLVPTTVNYTVLWNCGNIGYRHPQFQFGYKTDYGIEIVSALSRNISGDFDNDNNDDGENSSMPTIQARLSYLTSKMNVGLSGHFGEMKFTQLDNCKRCDSYSLNAHGSYSFMEVFQLKGEVFSGRVLDQYLGGIGQGFDIVSGKGIDSRGGWINAGFKASQNVSFNLGFGIDKLNDNDEMVLPFRSSNRSIFGNMFTKIAYNTTLAMEVSQWTTNYNNNDSIDTDSSNTRFHISFIHSL